MKLPEAAGLFLAFVARLITGAQGHWYGCPPKAEQRIHSANHQSHVDGALLWAALPRSICSSRSRWSVHSATTRSGGRVGGLLYGSTPFKPIGAVGLLDRAALLCRAGVRSFGTLVLRRLTLQ